MIQKTKSSILQTSHLQQPNREKNQSFTHTLRKLNMRSVTHMADVQKMIQLIPNFVQSAPSNKSYGRCDWLPHFGKDHYSDRINASPFIHII